MVTAPTAPDLAELPPLGGQQPWDLSPGVCCYPAGHKAAGENDVDPLRRELDHTAAKGHERLAGVRAGRPGAGPRPAQRQRPTVVADPDAFTDFSDPQQAGEDLERELASCSSLQGYLRGIHRGAKRARDSQARHEVRHERDARSSTSIARVRPRARRAGKTCATR